MILLKKTEANLKKLLKFPINIFVFYLFLFAYLFWLFIFTTI